MILEYEASDPKLEHMVPSSSIEVTRVRRPYDDALVISQNFAIIPLKRMLVDIESLTNILFLLTFIETRIEHAIVTKFPNWLGKLLWGTNNQVRNDKYH